MRGRRIIRLDPIYLVGFKTLSQTVQHLLEPRDFLALLDHHRIQFLSLAFHVTEMQLQSLQSSLCFVGFQNSSSRSV